MRWRHSSAHWPARWPATGGSCSWPATPAWGRRRCSRRWGRRPATGLLAGGYRDVEVEGTDAGGLLDAMTAERIRLTGLDREAVGELLAVTTGAEAPAELVRAVADRSGGNPLFVQELARLMAV